MEPQAILINRIIWEKCFKEQACVDIWPIGNKCVDLAACVKLLEDSSKYYIEIQLFSEARRFEIANVCYPVLEVGIGRLKVCTSDVVIDNNQFKSLKLLVEGCVGTDIGPVRVEKCWRLFDQEIKFFQLTANAMDPNGFTVLPGHNDILAFTDFNYKAQVIDSIS